MAQEAEKAATPTALTLPRAALATLTPEERQACARLAWQDRLVSLWAPVTVLALVFALYLTVVETSLCSYLWLMPAMQGVGLLCFAWWLGLVVARLGLRRWNAARKARYHGDEVLADFERTARKHGATLRGKVWDELVAADAGLRRAYLRGAPEVQEATRALDAAFEKHLAKLKGGGWIDLGSGFVRALLIALVFRMVLVEPYKIPSGSMLPTLEIGDQIFVNKFLYGVRLPLTNYVPFVLIRTPRRGDVIVFNNPVHTELDYVKRVIGIPGDRLEFTEDGVNINGVPLPKVLETRDFGYWDQHTPMSESLGAMLRRWTEDDWRYQGESLYRETVDGVQHHILDGPANHADTLARTQVRTVTVPEGTVFVMGDNRNNSEDSRFGLGDRTDRPRFVPFGYIKGKATVIWLSLSHGGFLSGLFGGTGIRYDRFFQPVSLCGTEAPLPASPPGAVLGGSP